MQVLLLAGGRGSRLDPYTRVLPKPLIPIDDRPIAEILIEQLRLAGAQEIVICLGYLANLIQVFFQDGSQFGIPIRYSLETIPLGTAGPLKRIEGLQENFIVVNGDELTTLDFKALYRHHVDQKADLTIAVQKKSVASSLGVLEIKKGQVVAYAEKPTQNYWVSMGIYVLNRRVLTWIPDHQRFDMPDLVQILLREKARVISYESQDLWFDIGTMEDLKKARQVFNTMNKEWGEH